MTKDTKHNREDTDLTAQEKDTQPETSQQDASQPETSQPDAASPEVSQPDASQQDVAPFEQNIDAPNFVMVTEKLPENSTEKSAEKSTSVAEELKEHTAPLNFSTTEEDSTVPKQEAGQEAGQKPQPNAAPSAPESADQNAGQSPDQSTSPVMGFAAKAFAHMSKLAPLYLLLLFVLHIFASIWLPSVYFPVEMAHMDVYQKMQATGQWLIPPTTEALTEALGVVLPGYYWFMALVDLLPLPESIFLPVLSALAALIALCGVYALGLCTKMGRHASFGGGLLILSCPLFLIFMHMVGPEMLTAGFFALSSALLYRGWTKESAPCSFIFGFLFLALATFTGGFIPLWTTLLASILLILWRGTLHRAHQLDAVIGFGVLVLSFALWLIISILGSEHATALDAIMLTAVAPFIPPYWPLPLPWALVFVLFGILPWLILPIFASWFSVLAKSFTNLKASRKENSGPTWLYLLAIIGMTLIVFQKNDALFSAFFLVPILGLILAKTLCNLSRLGSNMFFLLLAVCLLLCGVAITVMSIPATAPYWTPYLNEDMARILSAMKGLPLLSAVFILTALLLVRFTQRSFSEGALMVMALFFVLVAQPMTLFVAPSLVGHAAMQHPMGAGLGTLPPSIAPHMPTHPVSHERVAPIEGEEIPQNPEPTPVITAPEPTPELTPESAQEPTPDAAPEVAPESTPEAAPTTDATPEMTLDTVQEVTTEQNSEVQSEPVPTEPQVQPTEPAELAEPATPIEPAESTAPTEPEAATSL